MYKLTIGLLVVLFFLPCFQLWGRSDGGAISIAVVIHWFPTIPFSKSVAALHCSCQIYELS